MPSIRDTIKQSPFIKRLALLILQPRNQYKPRWIIRALVNPFVHKRGRGSVICGSTRMDVFPYNQFKLGTKSIIEDFGCVNNAVGDVIIGDRTLIGLSSVIIGPATIGNDVLLAQHVVLSALNHNYADPSTPISLQGFSTEPVIIEDGVWIGANAVVAPGVRIGKNAVVGAGSIVTRDVPAYSVVIGNPAKVMKQYNFETKTWDRVDKK